jgi:hypothetical protein
MTKKIDKLKKQIQSIIQELSNLEKFRDSTSKKKFARELMGERQVIQAKIKKLSESTKTKKEKSLQRKTSANIRRSLKMKRNWKYFNSIYDNYNTGLSKKQIRSEFTKFKKGLENSISEIIWRNPSP